MSIESLDSGPSLPSVICEMEDRAAELRRLRAEIERLRAALKICGAALGGHLSHAYAAHESHQQLQAAWKMIRDVDANQQSASNSEVSK